MNQDQRELYNSGVYQIRHAQSSYHLATKDFMISWGFEHQHPN